MTLKFKSILSYLYPIKIEHCAGNVSPHLEVNLVNGKYMLDTATVNYSYGSLQKNFDEAFQLFNLRERDAKNVLILGFGAGSVASLLTEKYGIDCKITGIEKDSVVIHLARKYFNIQRFKKLELISVDAYDYVQTQARKFDLIIVDIYIDKQVPKCFHEKRFLKQLDRLLQNNGALFFNKVVTSEPQKLEFNELVSNIEELFGHSQTYKLTRNNIDNYMLIHDRKASATNHSFILKPELNPKSFFSNFAFFPFFNGIK